MTHLIACAMLEQELKPYLPTDLSVTWMERGLHERPVQLQKALQETLGNLPSQVDKVLLGYGFCGGAVDGITCPTATLVLPLFDDCIGMLLQEQRQTRSLYFTAAWLEDEQFIANTYDRAVEDYGQEMADVVFRSVVGGYQSITLVDTHCFDVEVASQTMGACAQKLGLSLEKISGTTHLYIPPAQPRLHAVTVAVSRRDSHSLTD